LGKPYANEIAYIPTAYQWALEQEIKPLADTIGRLTSHGLIAVGSGGSYTAASFQVLLHESITGKLSYASTPYQLLIKSNVIRNVAVSVLSAEGKNKDVLGSFQYVCDAEPQDVMAFTLKSDSPLNELAVSTNFASSLSYNMPWDKDGYLATNSLISTCVLLYRAYQTKFNDLIPECPTSSDLLVENCVEIDPTSQSEFLKAIGNDRSKSFLVVTGLSGQIAGVDLESKIAESAMGTSHVVDFRSFAHGRHLWVSQNKSNAAVIVIWSDEEKHLYQNFLETIPESLPILSIKLKGPNYLRQLASIIAIVKLIKDLGDQHAIDPGQPLVAEAGKKIYAFDAFSEYRRNNYVSNKTRAITRKFGGAEIYGDSHVNQFRKAYDNFIGKLTTASFGAIVFDYDATLCKPDNRFKAIDPEVASLLNGLLDKGIRIGIATGRGKSVPEKLSEAISKHHHDQVMIGMYNGSKIKPLSARMVSNENTGAQFKQLEQRVNEEPFFHSVFKNIEGRPTQLTFEVKDGACCELAWRSICELLQDKDFKHLKALRSTHSWDVIKRDTSKVLVSERFVTEGLEVLSIGDRGLWPGNDCELLSQGLGLGVDEVSPIINKAWNIAPQGLKGVAATLYYLSKLQIKDGKFMYRRPEKNE
jgi:fructoselysine-6-P-deglycase FrlB-like protein